MPKEELTKEKLQKFWEWCGSRFSEFPFFLDYSKICVGIVFPDGTEQRCFEDELEKSLTLDNIFKYAVPKVKHYSYNLEEIRFIMNWNNEGGYLVDLTLSNPDCDRFSASCIQFSAQGKTPEVALFNAICEVIDNA
jgi:hypothetical protein